MRFAFLQFSTHTSSPPSNPACCPGSAPHTVTFDLCNRKWSQQLWLHGPPVFTALLICLSLGGDTCSSDCPRGHRAETRGHSQFHPNCVHTKTLIQRYNITGTILILLGIAWICTMQLLPMVSSFVYKHHQNAIMPYLVETALIMAGFANGEAVLSNTAI